MTGLGLGQMSEKETFWSSWQERLSALRNVPPVLKIVWRSGPGVVTFGITARIVAALLPIALAYIPKLIIDILDSHLRRHINRFVVHDIPMKKGIKGFEIRH